MTVVMIAWVFFRSESLSEALRYVGVLCGLGNASAATLSVRTQFGSLWPLLILGTLLALPVYPWLARRYGPLWGQLGTTVLGGALRAGYLAGLLVICASVMAVDQYNPFIYFRF
jgi:alginate O-acetyltransferase complex protein AlgI